MNDGKGQPLPVPGGYDEHGVLTTDAAAIERTQRALPIGFWKGSGLSFVLDVLAAMLSGGKATHEFSLDAAKEVGQSQVFLAIAPGSLSTMEEMSRVVSGAIDAVHAATPIEAGRKARYPGEGTLKVREESLRLGVAVQDAAWEAFEDLEQEGIGKRG
jgi:3-dehydro-L-gulonate 2-dehydrogenase